MQPPARQARLAVDCAHRCDQRVSVEPRRLRVGPYVKDEEAAAARMVRRKRAEVPSERRLARCGHMVVEEDEALAAQRSEQRYARLVGAAAFRCALRCALRRSGAANGGRLAVQPQAPQ